MASEYINPYEVPGDFTKNGLNLYSINSVTLENLQNMLWQNEPNFWESLAGKIQNATECIVSLHAIPCKATYATLSPPSYQGIVLGNKLLEMPAGAKTYNMLRYTTLVSDTIEFTEYYATILDYLPYTKIKIFLPYSGTYDIKTSDVMNGTMQIYCMVDMLTGDMNYTLMCNTNTNEPVKNLYHFSGNCKASIPLSSSDYSRMFENMRQGITSVAHSALGGAIVGGASAGTVTGAITGLNTIAGAIHDYNTPNINYSNNVSCENGWLSTQVPYFIIERPTTHVAEKYDNYIGYPSLLTLKLSDVTGYTEIESIHLDGLSAIDSEKNELERVLKGGVIF